MSSLLPKETRIKYLKDLGYDYNNGGTLKVQKRYFSDSKQHDDRWGINTDRLVRHLHNVWKYCKNFKPEEFKCKCGKCTGYPVQMKVNELKNLQQIRNHFGKPVTVTSGLRCSYQNSKVKGVKDSKHMTGYAADIYIQGVTDTLAGRKTAISWMKHLSKFNYAYGHGYNSLGQVISKPSMGNAVHIDSKK